MEDVVEIEIAAPAGEVARRFSDPANSPRWMTDLEKYEPISGDQGAPGSKYRLLTTKGMDFVATVIARELPRSVELVLDSAATTVSINTTFAELPAGRTKLRSVEEFRFKGLAGKAAAIFARRKIHAAHTEQMRAFKRFAESN